MKLYGELFEDSREVLLDALADAIDRYDQGRSKLADDTAECGSPEETQEGDFLYDFTRLNLQYLNHMARLGSNYSIVAGRVLEKLYDQFVPKAEPEERPLRVVSGVEGERKRVRITITNPSAAATSFSLGLRREAGVEAWLRPDAPPIPLAGSRSLVVDLMVGFPPALATNRDYALEILAEPHEGQGPVTLDIGRVLVRRVAQ